MSAGKKAVAVVDDDEAVLDATSSFLEALGYDTRAFNSGEAFLASSLAGDVSCLLTDINMPHMNGIDLTDTLRREMPEVKVVILTIYNDDDRVFAAIKAGARGYVLKDSPPEETIAAVRAAGKGEALLHPSLVSRVLSEFGRLSTQKAADNAVFAELTDREREVLTEIGKGRRNKEIADTLFISEKTVKNHISNIFAKLEVNSRAEAALLAARQGLV